MTYDISTIGEGQIRLTCYKGERLINAQQLRATAACSEANVSGLLSQLGRSTCWASVMPKGDLTDRVVNEFRSVGVDVSHICICLLYTSPSPRDATLSRMPSSA